AALTKAYHPTFDGRAHQDNQQCNLRTSIARRGEERDLRADARCAHGQNRDGQNRPDRHGGAPDCNPDSTAACPNRARMNYDRKSFTRKAWFFWLDRILFMSADRAPFSSVA